MANEEDEEFDFVTPTIDETINSARFVCGFTVHEKQLLFCWLSLAEESLSSKEIERELKNENSKYVIAGKNKQIYSKIKDCAIKFHKNKTPYDPTLINANSAPLVGQFLLLSNSWLELVSYLKKAIKKWSKVRQQDAAKGVLEMFSPQWSFFSHDLSSLCNEENGVSVASLVQVKEKLKQRELEIRRLSLRRSCMVFSWVSQCTLPVEVIQMLEQFLLYFEKVSSEIIKNLQLLYELQVQTQDKSCVKFGLENVKQFLQERGIFQLCKPPFPEAEDAAVVLCLCSDQMKSNFTYTKSSLQKGKFEPFFSGIKKDTTWNKRIIDYYSYCMNPPIDKSNGAQVELPQFDEDDKKRLISELKNLLTHGSKSTTFGRYYFLNDEHMMSTRSMQHESFELNALSWLQKLGEDISWPDLYLLRAGVMREHIPQVLELVEKMPQLSTAFVTSWLPYSSTTFTIDPENTRDIDDALTVLHFNAHSIRIAVHIANVASYILSSGNSTPVQFPFERKTTRDCKLSMEAQIEEAAKQMRKQVEEHPLFQESKRRITSVYIPGEEESYTMLPKELSENKLSLLAGSDKHVISYIFTIYSNGSYQFEGFCKGIIRVSQNLSFNEVDDLIEKENMNTQSLGCWAVLHHCCTALYEQRILHGTKIFTNDGDLKISLVDNEYEHQVIPYFDNYPYKSSTIITELCVLVNSCMAKFFMDSNIPALFRKTITQSIDILDSAMMQLDSDYFVSIASMVREPNLQQQQPQSEEAFSYAAKTRAHRQKNFATLKNHLVSQQKFAETMTLTKLSIGTNMYQNINGVPYYLTLTSPLRRFVDMIMQLQLVYFLEHNSRVLHIQQQHQRQQPTIPFCSLFPSDAMQQWATEIHENTSNIRNIERQVLYHWVIMFLHHQWSQGIVNIRVMTDRTWRKDQQDRITQQQEVQYQLLQEHAWMHQHQPNIAYPPLPPEPFFFSDPNMPIQHQEQQQFDQSEFQTKQCVQFLPLVHSTYFTTHPMFAHLNKTRYAQSSTIKQQQKQQRNPYLRVQKNVPPEQVTEPTVIKVRLVDLNFFPLEVNMIRESDKQRMQKSIASVSLVMKHVDMLSHTVTVAMT